jgi:hypothetical protein
MRARWLLAVLLLAACTKKSLVRCTDQATCAPYGAVCLEDGYCHNPREEMLDLATLDLAVPADLSPMCTDNSACTTRTAPICDTTTHTCRACASDECAGNAAGTLCAASGPLAGACVSCLDETPCAAAHQYCDAATASCATCSSGPQCASGACDAGGCVAASDVVYVDNNQTPCAGADGTRNKAYCTLAAALAARGSKQYVRVAGSVTDYAGFALDMTSPSTPLWVVGPGANATPPARIGPIDPASASAQSTVALTLNTPTPVTLEGLHLVGRPGNNQDYMLFVAGSALLVRDCSLHGTSGNAVYHAAGTLTLLRDEIHTSGDPAVKVANAFAPVSITVQQCDVHDNITGLSLQGSQPITYTVENDIFRHNQRGAISLGANAGAFRFNTVVGNGYTVADYAVYCGGGAPALHSSIIAGNAQIAGTQLPSTCTLDQVVTGTDGHAGAIQLLPTFVSATDFHLKPGDAANLACCVDKASAGPALDLDGKSRPLGGGWDIGAYEAQ